METTRPVVPRVLVLLALLCGLAAWQTPVVCAATYYVALTGNNANPGSQAQPFQTIGHGLSVLVAGDVLFIRGGNYNEDVGNLNGLSASGTSWANPITVSGFAGETAIVRNVGLNTCGFNYILFKDLSVTRSAGAFCYVDDTIGAGDQYVRFQNLDIYGWAGNTDGLDVFANHVEVLGGKIHDAQAYTSAVCDAVNSAACHGIYTHGDSNVFDGIEIYHVTGYCIHQYGAYPNTENSNSIYRNLRLHDCGKAESASLGGLLIAGSSGNNSTNNKAYNNVIYNIPFSVGIDIGYTVSNTEIYNNTIYNTGDVSLAIANATNTIARNNILPNGIRDTASGTIADHNLLANASYVNAGAGDFHLTSGATTAIDQGVTVALVTVDIDGGVRPTGPFYDIGAYEFGSTGGPPPPLAVPTNLRRVLLGP